jgi:asparagine synthase (glutamine-hydrolysing)
VISDIAKSAKRWFFDRRTPPIVRSVRDDCLTYLDDAALVDLFEKIKELEATGKAGVFIEAGCALGGSAIVIAAAKSKTRPFYVFDVFDLIPPPSGEDGPDVQRRYSEIKHGRSVGIGGNRYYGYEADLLEKVTEAFRRHGVPIKANHVHLVPGLFQNTLRLQERVLFAHIDGDWYESVLTCLRRIEPHLVAGGVLVIDDYDSWSGCRKAVDAYFEDKKDRYQFTRKSRLHIVRK